ncbi:linker histone h1 and h5 family domain-containing protein [Phthorimaea operculella]|nr:linker histone h1 and h5 family domain-containing protein [Phthorimaea operculella]
MASSKRMRIRRRQCGGGRQNTGELVLSAIKKLRRYTGWTARTIVKFIKMEYQLNNDPNLSRKVSRALKRGVNLGLLVKDRGRYRLNSNALSSSVDSSRHVSSMSRRTYRTSRKYR